MLAMLALPESVRPGGADPPATAPIRVLVADDHPLVRQGLALFLARYPDLLLVGEAGTGAEAVRHAVAVQPDVVLMDLVMPEMDGAEATRLIRERCPRAQILILSSFGEEQQMQAALAAGAIGYLLKSANVDEIVRAIRAAHAGQPVLDPAAAQTLVRAAAHRFRIGQNLTGRERDVLALLAEGLDNNEIARRLVVSRATVKFHVSSLLNKLGAANRTEAVALAFQHHLVNGHTAARGA